MVSFGRQIGQLEAVVESYKFSTEKSMKEEPSSTSASRPHHIKTVKNELVPEMTKMDYHLKLRHLLIQMGRADTSVFFKIFATY